MLIVYDMGKNPDLARGYEKKTGKSVSGLNHDMILSEAIDARIVPYIQRLPQQQRSDLMLGFRTSAGLYFG